MFVRNLTKFADLPTTPVPLCSVDRACAGLRRLETATSGAKNQYGRYRVQTIGRINGTLFMPLSGALYSAT